MSRSATKRSNVWSPPKMELSILGEVYVRRFEESRHTGALCLLQAFGFATGIEVVGLLDPEVLIQVLILMRNLGHPSPRRTVALRSLFRLGVDFRPRSCATIPWIATWVISSLLISAARVRIPMSPLKRKYGSSTKNTLLSRMLALRIGCSGALSQRREYAAPQVRLYRQHRER